MRCEKGVGAESHQNFKMPLDEVVDRLNAMRVWKSMGRSVEQSVTMGWAPASNFSALTPHPLPSAAPTHDRSHISSSVT